MVEKALSAFFLLLSLTFLYTAVAGFTFGALSSPKSGFLPTVTAAAASLLALANLVGVLRRPNPGVGIPRGALRKIGGFSAVLVIYLILLKYAGFATATFAALLLLLKVTGTAGWLLPVLVAGGVAGGAKLIFGYLGVVFP